MKRSLFCFALFSVIGLGLVSPAAGQETVQVFDRIKNAVVPVSGKIQSEDASKIVLKPSIGANRELPAIDVVDVTYEIRPALIVDYNSPRNAEIQAGKATSSAERKKQWQDALQKYKAFRPKVEDKPLQRHIDYKIAYLTARLGEDDATQRDAAVQALTKYKTDYPDGWQISHACKLLAGLLMEKGSTDKTAYAEAQKVYEDLAKLPLSKEMKQEADLLVAQAMIQGQKYKEAEDKLQTAQKGLAESDPQMIKVKVFLARCRAGGGQTENDAAAKQRFETAIRELDDIIKKSNDPNLRAVAHNTLGDCYKSNGQLRDAMWQYLWVDVVFNQDRQEHLKAVAQLAELFDKMEPKDEDKAKQYRDKLASMK